MPIMNAKSQQRTNSRCLIPYHKGVKYYKTNIIFVCSCFLGL